MIGRTLGPYTVLAKLGAGEMGEVYRVRDTRLNRDVAIKVLSGVTIHAVERLRPVRGASPRDAEHVSSGGGLPASGENAETTHFSRWNWSKAGRSPKSFHAAA
jgi:serine/threonine protein kinase